jgi:GNAT superfamily N-acetyltransferase
MSNYAAEKKVPPYNIVKITNQDKSFYEKVGKFLARREIVAEIGAPIWDDDGKIWFIADSESLGVLGIIAIKKNELCSFYVLPGSRGQLIGYALINYAINNADNPNTLKATASESGKSLFEKFNFKSIKQRGKFTVMERIANHA